MLLYLGSFKLSPLFLLLLLVVFSHFSNLTVDTVTWYISSSIFFKIFLLSLLLLFFFSFLVFLFTWSISHMTCLHHMIILLLVSLFSRSISHVVCLYATPMSLPSLYHRFASLHSICITVLVYHGLTILFIFHLFLAKLSVIIISSSNSLLFTIVI